MSIFELLLIAVVLSMDAFAIAVGKGLTMRRVTLKKSLPVGLYFGAFQAIMPLIGYLAGIQFADMIRSIDHWVAFVLLFIIGAKMIIDSLTKDGPAEAGAVDDSLSPAKMLPLAVATSIDALAVGVSFAFLQVRIFVAIAIIGCTTLLLSVWGVIIGHSIGLRFKSHAELAGGMLLILMGLKILLEHLGLLSF